MTKLTERFFRNFRDGFARGAVPIRMLLPNAKPLGKTKIIIGDICTMQGEKPENHFVVVDIETDGQITVYSNATGAIEVERERLTIVKRGGVAFCDK